MKPPVFEYYDPRTLDEALALLGQWGGDAKVLAGGQSLVPLLNFRLVKPRALVDINRIPELAYVRQVDNAVAFGACARQSAVASSPEVARLCPLLGEVLPFVGHAATRNRGTVVGSIAHADPAAEFAVVATALEAELEARSAQGARTLRPEEFFVSYFTTALEPTELLAEVRFPALGPRTGWGFLEVSRRHGDFAVVAAVSVVALDAQGHCQRVRVALGGVGGTPVRARAVEEALTGARPTPEALAKAADLVRREVEPESDVHASAEYRREVAAVLVRRTLQAAVERVDAR